MQEIQTPKSRILIKVEITPDFASETKDADVLAQRMEADRLLAETAALYEEMIRRDMVTKIEYILSLTK